MGAAKLITLYLCGHPRLPLELEPTFLFLLTDEQFVSLARHGSGILHVPHQRQMNHHKAFQIDSWQSVKSPESPGSKS